MILVVGGGWSGSRICARDPNRFITTTRSAEKLHQLTSLGLNAVLFDLLDEATWSNLPPKEDVEATIFTFEILGSQLPQLESLWEKHIASDSPVLCYGTSSVFEPLPIVNETAALTGLSITGHSLADRVKGEEWALSKGATVLHLSSIKTDEETERTHKGIPGLRPRTIKSFVLAGYIKSGFKLVNFIHINDIYKISLHLIDKLKMADSTIRDQIKGQRIITSCGAFRVQHFIRALGMDLLPDETPPNGFFEGNKILSTAKLIALLPDDYEWALPLKGVEPVSQGLPLAGLVEGGAFCDEVWTSVTNNFRGLWQGLGTLYTRNKGEENGGRISHKNFIAEMKGASLPVPTKNQKVEINVFVVDAVTAIWRCTGLLMGTDGEKTLSRDKLVNALRSFSFPGAGGRCNVTKPCILFECNFFYNRSRLTIVTTYSPDSTTGVWQLDSVLISAYRCGHGCEVPIKPTQDEVRGNIHELVRSLEGKKCHRESISYWYPKPGVLNRTTEQCEYPTNSICLFSDPDRVVQLFDDDIVCSVPPEITPGETKDFVFGCFHNDKYAQIFTITYDSKEEKTPICRLDKWND